MDKDDVDEFAEAAVVDEAEDRCLSTMIDSEDDVGGLRAGAALGGRPPDDCDCGVGRQAACAERQARAAPSDCGETV
ncbi:hypothetical protein OHB00_06615 [Streptomyces sp. NBC_00631]|uniref:hypothetical protein n=1 Tax=Streptomyces sp. NBC_00631 TaxID=2975793 RepID=UPI0030E17DDD